jgi:hypothetical protein
LHAGIEVMLALGHQHDVTQAYDRKLAHMGFCMGTNVSREFKGIYTGRL